MDKAKKRLQKLDGTMIFFISVLAFDLVVILLAFNDYYFSFVKLTNNILPILLTLVSFYALANARKIERFWVITVTIVAVLLLGLFSITNNSYDTIESPTGNVKVVIGHRDATLGETNHFYKFYLYISIPGLMKKVNEHRIMTRGVNADNLEVLGVDNTEWIDDEKVIFHSSYAETTQVDLKQ